jgi:hypothetical protein
MVTVSSVPNAVQETQEVVDLSRTVSVRSDSNPRKWYEVTIRPDGTAGTCTCMAYRFSKGPRAFAMCKHIRSFVPEKTLKLHDETMKSMVDGYKVPRVHEGNRTMGWLLGSKVYE